MKPLSNKIKITGWTFIFFFITGLMTCGVQVGVEVLPKTQTVTYKINDEMLNPGKRWACLPAIQTEPDEAGIIDRLGMPQGLIDGDTRTLQYRFNSYPSGYRIWLLTIPIPITNHKNYTGCDVHIYEGAPISATVYYRPSTYFYGCIKKNDPTVSTKAGGCYKGAEKFDMYLPEDEFGQDKTGRERR